MSIKTACTLCTALNIMEAADRSCWQYPGSCQQGSRQLSRFTRGENGQALPAEAVSKEGRQLANVKVHERRERTTAAGRSCQQGRRQLSMFMRGENGPQLLPVWSPSAVQPETDGWFWIHP